MCPRFKVWRVPWWRTEHWEKLEDTLLREMKEETGLSLENPMFIGFGQDTQFHILWQRNTSRLIMYYLVNAPDTRIVLDPDECEEHKWVTIEEIINIENKEWALTDLFTRNPTLKNSL